MKQEGGENDLLDRLKADPAFAKVDITSELDPSRFVGRAPEQVTEFLETQVSPIRRKYAGHFASGDELRV